MSLSTVSCQHATSINDSGWRRRRIRKIKEAEGTDGITREKEEEEEKKAEEQEMKRRLGSRRLGKDNVLISRRKKTVKLILANW